MRHVVSGVVSLGLSSVVLAGSLAPPPGAIQPTMKPLDLVEPRIPISPTTTPGNGLATFILSQPGSYYLPSSMQGEVGKHGILITSSDVTVDLNGFAVIGIAGTQIGVFANLNPDLSLDQNIEVKNGSVTGWGGAGVAVFANSARIEDVRSASNAGQGFFLQEGVIDRCTARFNAQSGYRLGPGVVATGCVANENFAHGFEAIGSGVAFDHCVARDNTLDGFNTTEDLQAMIIGGSRFAGCLSEGNANGFDTGDGPVFESCAARLNNLDGIRIGRGGTAIACSASLNMGDGFEASVGCVISACSGFSNTGAGFRTSSGCTIDRSTAYFNEGDGIVTQSASTINGCTASFNRLDGIEHSGSCLIVDNMGASNGRGGDGAGILSNGAGSRIDGNNAVNNDRGFDVDGPNNIILRNTASQNFDDGSGMNRDFDLVPGNHTGQINLITGETIIVTNPWANFRY